MLRHYLKIFFRNLLHRDLVTYINIFGLSVGLACTLLILQWLRNELSYDTFHASYEDIYRIDLIDFREGVADDPSPITMIPIGPAFSENFPEIRSFVRLREIGDLSAQHGEDHYTIESIVAADSSFFDIFSFHLVEGNPKTALAEPNSLVLTESMARKVFPLESALGKSLVVNGADHYVVTGVVADPPQNSHIKFGGLLSMSTLWQGRICTKWDCNYSFYTYLLLNPGANVEQLEAKFPDFLWEPLNKKNAQAGWEEVAQLMPLGDIHFGSTSNHELEPPGNTGMVYLFIAIALFILAIACINFINLSTAQSARKGREIGIKKVAGASRLQLAGQHLGEVFILGLVAMLLSIVFAELARPTFDGLLQMDLQVDYWSTGFILTSMAFLLLITFGAGAYPAFYLTRFVPAKVLKGKHVNGAQHSTLRNTLVAIQFTISISLIAGTIIIYNQLHFIASQSLGFEKENVITIQLSNEEARSKWTALKQEIGQVHEVVSVGASTFVPGGGATSNGYLPEGLESHIMLKVLDIDENYLQTMGIDIALGRNFTMQSEADKSAFIINEQLARQLNWDDPIGKTINRNGIDHPVIGLVQNFNFSSLHHQMEPLILTMNPWEGIQSYGYLSVRIKPGDVALTIQKLGQIWENNIDSLPFEFSFLEDRLNSQYFSEQRLGEVFIWFSSLAIFISCMGLFGLVLFMVEQKTKEIGVRKALGGSVSDILMLLSGDFTKLIFVALLLAVPLTWIAMDNWLSNFAYATQISWWIFAVAGVFTLSISWLTVSWHTVKAAIKNPVEALRYE